MKEIEGKFSLQEKEVSKVRLIGCINAGQDCQEVVLECANGSFRLIVVMHVRRDKLEGGIPLEGDYFSQAELALLSRIRRSTENPQAAKQVMMVL